MLCEHCLIERTDNLEGIPGKTENGFFGLSLPWTFTISASFGQCFPYTAVYFETTNLDLRMTEIHFFFLILWKFVYRYSFTTGSIVSFTKSNTTRKNHSSLCNSLFSAKIKY